MRVLRFVVLLCLLTSPALAAENTYLYKVTLVQAAPGKLLEVIDLYKQRATELQATGDEAPLWMRHSQGDHWDLMILYPMENYESYYEKARIAKRSQALDPKLETKVKDGIAWQEDLFVYGPAVAEVRKN